LNNS
jgi:hypothetical protein